METINICKTNKTVNMTGDDDNSVIAMTLQPLGQCRKTTQNNTFFLIRKKIIKLFTIYMLYFVDNAFQHYLLWIFS